LKQELPTFERRYLLSPAAGRPIFSLAQQSVIPHATTPKTKRGARLAANAPFEVPRLIVSTDRLLLIAASRFSELLSADFFRLSAQIAAP
jgi:hypothetical protein